MQPEGGAVVVVHSLLVLCRERSLTQWGIGNKFAVVSFHEFCNLVLIVVRLPLLHKGVQFARFVTDQGRSVQVDTLSPSMSVRSITKYPWNILNIAPDRGLVRPSAFYCSVEHHARSTVFLDLTRVV